MKKTSVAIAVLMATLPVAGCAAKEPPSPAESAAASADQATAESATAQNTTTQNTGQPTGEDSPSATSTAAEDLGDPVGTKQITSGGVGYKVSMYPLRRQGKAVLMTADLGYTKLGSNSSVDGRILTDSSSTWSTVKQVPNGFALIDQAGEKMYLPALADPDVVESSLCSPTPPSSARVGDVVTVTCTFAGVPETESMMSIKTDKFGTFANVQIK
ncbi:MULTISPECIES: hypothetical protein [unclassified Luteococcus]|uniref:hypothetical protein n=1 Tax=unclassified Luteococcus TaxID=2639923 RepID=UPI00313C1C7E